MLSWKPLVHGLGVAEMDATHEEFAGLVAAAGSASDAEFPQLLEILAEHTRTHFANESRLMRDCGFPALAEHEGEHQRVLGEVAQMQRAAAQGRLRLARLYVTQGLPEWFRNHLATMDAALAACLRKRQRPAQPVRAPVPRSVPALADREP